MILATSLVHAWLFVDVITQTTEQRRSDLASKYHFECRCSRCKSTNAYDMALEKKVDAACRERIEALHAKAEMNGTSIAEALRLYQSSLAIPCPSLSPLRYKSAHGLLLHADAEGDMNLIEKGSKVLLSFYDNFIDSFGETLKVDQIEIRLKLATTLTMRGLTDEANDHLVCCVHALRAFDCDLQDLAL